MGKYIKTLMMLLVMMTFVTGCFKAEVVGRSISSECEPASGHPCGP